MAAALEILIIPTFLLLTILFLGVLTDFSLGMVVVAAVLASLLLLSVVLLLRTTRDLEGPPEEHETHDDPK